MRGMYTVYYVYKCKFSSDDERTNNLDFSFVDFIYFYPLKMKNWISVMGSSKRCYTKQISLLNNFLILYKLSIIKNELIPFLLRNIFK